LKSRYSQLNVDVQSQIVDIINQVCENAKDDDAERHVQAQQIAFAKLRWLSAIFDRQFEPARKLYNECYEITGVVPKHPDFSTYMESGWVGENSQHTADELLSRSDKNLAALLNSFVEQPGWNNPTRRGLSLEFKKAIKADPDRFIKHLQNFKNLHFDFIVNIIEGYVELLVGDMNSHKEIWIYLLDFCEEIVSLPKFWEKPEGNGQEYLTANYSWVVSSIADAIRSGTSDDKFAFEAELLPVSRRILEIILENQEGEEFPDKCDAVSISINSSRGKCIEALINYALRRCRLADKTKSGRAKIWHSDLKFLFEKEFSKISDSNHEFVTLFANYLPNFIYLDRDWMLEHLPLEHF